MTPTTTEREARELLAREYERSGYAPSGIREGDRAVVLCDAAIRAIIAALTREQEVQGSVVCRLHPRYKAKLPPRSTAVGCICAEIYNHKHPAPPNTTPPAPVDVRAALPKVTFKNVQRGDCGKYPDGTGWGHAWSAPIVEIERADWDRFIALLDGQPAGVDRG